METKKHNSWSEAKEEGFKLVIKANRLDEAEDGFESDKKLSELAAKALLLGIDPEWIQDMLSVGCEGNIQSCIKRKLH